jgi:membrane protein
MTRVLHQLGRYWATVWSAPVGFWHHFWRYWATIWGALGQVMAMSDRTHMGLMAAGIAFFGMFAIFPALGALIAIFGLIADPVVVEEQVLMLEDVMPPGASELISDQVHRLVTAQGGTLGWTTLFSLLLALWSARAGVASLVQGLNAIHEIPNRGGLLHTLVSILLTLALIAIGLTGLFAVIIAPILIALAPVAYSTSWILEGVRWLVALTALLMALGILYRFGPNGRVRLAWVTPGAVLVIILWLGSSALFSAYLVRFDSYNQIYGSIGAVIALMMWLYISAYLVLLGAAFNEVIVGNQNPDHGL